MKAHLNTFRDKLVVGATYYVDNNAVNTTQVQAGSPAFPFATIQRAVDAGVAAGLKVIGISIAASNMSYPDPILLPDGYGFILEGWVSGSAQIGDIIWKTSGGLNPLVPQSYLLCRNCAPTSITIKDGCTPATASLLIGENMALLGSLTAIGTSFVTIQLGGINASAFSVIGNNASSLVIGSIIAPHCNLSLTNTQVIGDINVRQLFASTSEFNGHNIELAMMSEINNSIFRNSLTIIFTGFSNALMMDTQTYYQLLQATYVMINGTLNVIGNSMLGSATISVDNADITLLPYQYSTETIVLTGELAADINRTITFPIGMWLIDATCVTFTKSSKITIVNNFNSATLTTPDLYIISVQINKITIK